jgi:hypothetical protein
MSRLASQSGSARLVGSTSSKTWLGSARSRLASRTELESAHKLFFPALRGMTEHGNRLCGEEGMGKAEQGVGMLEHRIVEM